MKKREEDIDFMAALKPFPISHIFLLLLQCALLALSDWFSLCREAFNLLMFALFNFH